MTDTELELFRQEIKSSMEKNAIYKTFSETERKQCRELIDEQIKGALKMTDTELELFRQEVRDFMVDTNRKFRMQDAFNVGTKRSKRMELLIASAEEAEAFRHMLSESEGH